MHGMSRTIFFLLHLQIANNVDESKGIIKADPSHKPVNQSGDCQIENESVKVLQTKKKSENAKKTAKVSKESQKKNSQKTSNKVTKRGCLDSLG